MPVLQSYCVLTQWVVSRHELCCIPIMSGGEGAGLSLARQEAVCGQADHTGGADCSACSTTRGHLFPLLQSTANVTCESVTDSPCSRTSPPSTQWPSPRGRRASAWWSPPALSLRVSSHCQSSRRNNKTVQNSLKEINRSYRNASYFINILKHRKHCGR